MLDALKGWIWLSSNYVETGKEEVRNVESRKSLDNLIYSPCTNYAPYNSGGMIRISRLERMCKDVVVYFRV